MADIVEQLLDVTEGIQRNVGMLTEAVKLMDKKMDSLQAENEKLKEELAVVKKAVKSIWKFT